MLTAPADMIGGWTGPHGLLDSHHTPTEGLDMLTFVETHLLGSLYRRPDGTLILKAAGTFTEPIAYDLDEIRDAWDTFPGSQDDFLRQLRAALAHNNGWNPDVYFCADCSDLEDTDNGGATVNGNSTVCDSCLDSYYSCSYCSGWFSDTTTVGYDNEVCETCLHDNFTYCEPCEAYYRDSYGCDGEACQTGCDCVQPHLNFTMPNGDSVVSQDEPVAVAMPAGHITDEGCYAIQRAIIDHGRNGQPLVLHPHALAEITSRWVNFSYLIGQIGQEWQTTRGNYTKRLSRLAHTEAGLKIPAALVSKIGNLAREHSVGTDVTVEITRDLNQSAEDFGHEGSCWFTAGEYGESRCTLKNNGGFGLRTFTEHAGYGGHVYRETVGRAWVLPLVKGTDGDLVPTFDTTTADAFVVFNGYGNLSGYTPARIVAQMVGGTYRKISFDSGSMYVNSESGYLVGAEDIVKPFTDGSLYLDIDTHPSLTDVERMAAPRDPLAQILVTA